MSEVLGEDFEQAFCGVVYSEPQSEAQLWHADSLHIYDNHGDANLLNGLIALHDTPMEMGPTEFNARSHLLTNHRRNTKCDGINIVYQTHLNEPEQIGADPCANFTMDLPAGSLVLFDDRVLHRGRGNNSDCPRYVGYFSYRRPWFHADTHFEVRGVGGLVRFECGSRRRCADPNFIE